MKRILMLTGIALATLTMLPLQVAATPISTSIALDTVYAGNTPDGSAPWLTATFTSSVGSNTGTLVLTSDLTGPDFVQGLENSKAAIGWAFYLNQAVSGITCAAGTCAGNGASYKAGGFNSGPVPVKDSFNLAFGWCAPKAKGCASSSGRFMAGDSATYDLMFLNPLTGNPFVENDSGWSSVAHIQGIYPNCSGWIVSGDGSGAHGSGPCTRTPRSTVPEPGMLGMFGLGLLFAGLFLGLRRRYN